MLFCEDCIEVFGPEMPLEILQAAAEGNVETIEDYLDEGGDVNGQHNGQYLLSKACAEGHPELVKLLLQRKDIHVNKTFYEMTPINRAAENGHLECVKVLMDANCFCKVEYEHCWVTIANCLQMKPQLQLNSASHLLQWASYEGHWDAVTPLLETKHHFTKDDLYPIVMKAVEQDRWDVVHRAFERNFYGKMDLVKEVFAITVNMRSWGKVEELMLLFDSDLKFDVNFVEAAFCGKILPERSYDPPTVNGNLLVVAAGGMDEPAAEFLMNIKNIYTKRTFSNALFLTALRDGAELFPKLLNNAEASYSIKDLHQADQNLKCHNQEGFLLTYLKNYMKKTYDIS